MGDEGLEPATNRLRVYYKQRKTSSFKLYPKFLCDFYVILC
jgi:hypothetical protein